MYLLVVILPFLRNKVFHRGDPLLSISIVSRGPDNYRVNSPGVMNTIFVHCSVRLHSSTTSSKCFVHSSLKLSHIAHL